MKTSRMVAMLGMVVLLAQFATGAPHSDEHQPRVRIIASKQPKKGLEAAKDVNEACLQHNNHMEECLADNACTVVPVDDDILCLSKKYVASVLGAIAKGDATVIPNKTTKKRCEDASNGSACKRTQGCEIFRFNDKEICAPKEGGYEINKQDYNIFLFDSFNELRANAGVEHLNVFDSSEARDEWSFFADILAFGDTPFYQFAGIRYRAGDIVESGIGSRITNNEITVGTTSKRDIDNNIVVGLPFLSYSTAK